MTRGWSSRILTLAVAGILFLTLYPFRFSIYSNSSSNPFLLAGWGKGGPLATFLNILLFIPFGWGLAQKLREEGQSRVKTLFLTAASGALFSYGIEFLQFYIPTRDSGWNDILTNGTGAACGSLAFDLLDGRVLDALSGLESGVERLLTMSRALWIVPIYFIAWLSLSAFLQKDSSLSNWVQDVQLVVGNDASGHVDRAWKGEVARLELWDHPVADAIARRITSDETNGDTLKPLAIYAFAGSSPYPDQKAFLPELKWIPGAPETQDPRDAVLGGSAWLGSQVAVNGLVRALENANKFSLYVVCTPAEAEGSDGRVVSISDDRQVNLSLRQRDKNLVFWFRNPVSMRRDQLSLTIPDTFDAHQMRRILVSYDGSNLSFYIDGKRDSRRYELTPGTPLAQLVRHIKTNELEGYSYIYYALVFVPAGVLLGIASRRITLWTSSKVLFLLVALVLPSILLEALLIRVSGRAPSLGNVVLGAVFGVLGLLWINLDQAEPRRTWANALSK